MDRTKFWKAKKQISNWIVNPDFVSVNFSEYNFEEIIKILLDKGIKIEAGLSNTIDALKLIDTGLYRHCFRILIEPQEQNISDALNNITEIESIILPVIANQKILLHGVDNTCWDLMKRHLKEIIVQELDLKISFILNQEQRQRVMQNL